MRLKGLIVGLTLIITAAVLLTAHSMNSGEVYGKVGTDVSWPNCKLSVLEPSSWGIVGVTGGLDFRPNPCLFKESTWFTQYALYLNTGYPGESVSKKFSSFPLACALNNQICLAYNYGYNAARYGVDYATQQAIHANTWWLDVETDNSWTSNYPQNQAALEGMVDAIHHYTILSQVGVYSSAQQWKTITGGWHNNLPEWLATGGADRPVAAQACDQSSFSGGPIWLTQYTLDLDVNYTCNPDFPTLIHNH